MKRIGHVVKIIEHIVFCVRVFVRLLHVHQLLGKLHGVIVYVSVFISDGVLLTPSIIYVCLRVCLSFVWDIHGNLREVDVDVSVFMSGGVMFVCVFVCILCAIFIEIPVRWLFTCLCYCWMASYLFVCSFVLCLRFLWKSEWGGCLRVAFDDG